MKEVINQTTARVLTTTNYGMFKILDGNREVIKPRIGRIKRSIMENGYIHNPIIVNERMEVIDGQGRLEALRQLEMPVEYLVYKDLTIFHCIALNISQTPWTLMDYIRSYAERGSTSYQFLYTLIKRYNKLTPGICSCACTGNISDGKYSKIKTGDFECTGEQYERADELLAYVMRFHKAIKTHKKGPDNYICHAIMFAFSMRNVDKERLVQRFNDLYGLEAIKKFNNSIDAFRLLTQVYSYRGKVEKVYFEVEYDVSMRKRYPWYTKRYSEKREG